MADTVLFSASATQRTLGFQKETLINSSLLRRDNLTPPEFSLILASDWSANLHRALDGVEPACQRISAADLASRPVKWPDLSLEAPEQLDYHQVQFALRKHQEEAFNDVVNGFKDADRGKLIMACGTGKTFYGTQNRRGDRWCRW